MKSSFFITMFLLFISFEQGYSVETKKIVGEEVILQGKTLLWEISTFELKKETYVSSFSNNCFVIDNPDLTNKRELVVNEIIKIGMRLIIAENCEITLSDEDGIYTFKYSDYERFTYVEIIEKNTK